MDREEVLPLVPARVSPHESYPGPYQGVPATVVVGCSGLTLCGRVFECRGPVRAVPISERSQRRQRPRFPCTQRPPCTERLAPVFRWDITTPRSARSRSGSSLASLCVSSSRSCTPGSATGRAPRAHQPEAGVDHHAASSKKRVWRPASKGDKALETRRSQRARGELHPSRVLRRPIEDVYRPSMLAIWADRSRSRGSC